MTLKYHPKPGAILMCDFSKGFVQPEMVKVRPVVVLATGGRHNSGIVTVAALSTVPPKPALHHHCKIDSKHLPKIALFQGKESWLKGDMLYSVGFNRLNQIKVGQSHSGRIYFNERLGREKMKEIYGCVLHGLNLGHVAQHL